MSSIILYPDMPCAYPTTLGANIKTGVGNTPTVLAVFKNNSSIENLRAILQNFEFTVFNASDDTLVTLQLVSGVTSSGGTFNPVGGNSTLEVNLTPTSVSGGSVALTTYSLATTGQGVTSQASSLSDIGAKDLGLVLPIGMQFAIYAKTETATSTVDIAWSCNWLEKD